MLNAAICLLVNSTKTAEARALICCDEIAEIELVLRLWIASLISAFNASLLRPAAAVELIPPTWYPDSKLKSIVDKLAIC